MLVIASLDVVNHLSIPVDWFKSYPVYSGATDAMVQWQNDGRGFWQQIDALVETLDGLTAEDVDQVISRVIIPPQLGASRISDIAMPSDCAQSGSAV